MSRRTLERDFRSALGRSVNVELRRKRLEQMKELLRIAEFKIPQMSYSYITMSYILNHYYTGDELMVTVARVVGAKLGQSIEL